MEGSLGFPPPRQLWTEARCRFLSRVFGLSSNVMILLLIRFSLFVTILFVVDSLDKHMQNEKS